MELRVLAVGDVVSEAGLAYFEKKLRPLIKEYAIDFTVVNGENAAGIGVLPEQAMRLYDAGADVITLGNHTWGKGQITSLLEDAPYLLRPANFAPHLPGRGMGIYEAKNGLRVAVLSLMGRLNVNPHLANPLETADKLLAQAEADVVLVDFHAEATSEKGALAWHLDGRAQAIWGTHTHVPTADLQVLPHGTGFVTDLGMTGPAQSILGIAPEDSINLFLGGIPRRYQPASGPCKLNSVLFTIDTAKKCCTSLQRIDLLG